MNDTTNTLLDAVDALTLTIRRKVIQDGPPGSGLAGQNTVTIELPSLLDQLDDAIRGTIGIGGSGSLASERNMLDADALYRLVLITTLINDWARAAKAEVTKADAGKTLRAWYVKYTQTQHEPAVDRFHIRKLVGWAEQITQKLDPANVWDLPDPCPVCGNGTWWNPADKTEYLRPLVIEYRPNGPDTIQKARGLCRACAQVWSVRELAYEIEQAERRRVADAETPETA
jgi:hypothetical protein